MNDYQQLKRKYMNDYQLVEQLTDYCGSLQDLQNIIAALIIIYSPDAIIKFDAGANNVTAEII